MLKNFNILNTARFYLYGSFVTRCGNIIILLEHIVEGKYSSSGLNTNVVFYICANLILTNSQSVTLYT
jgi:hypothetical protein